MICLECCRVGVCGGGAFHRSRRPIQGRNGGFLSFFMSFDVYHGSILF